MIKLTKRKGFNFFRSYFDVYNELETNEDKVAFMDALLERQFMGIKPTELKGMAKFAYISQTNSIDSQVKGYEDKTKTTLHPTQGGCVGVITPPALQVEGKEEEKVKENTTSIITEVREEKHFIYLKECLEQPTWLEEISRREKIPLDKISLALKDFNGHLLATGENKIYLKDYKYHFVMWVRKRKLS